jgi:hypothetical protein
MIYMVSAVKCRVRAAKPNIETQSNGGIRIQALVDKYLITFCDMETFKQTPAFGLPSCGLFCFSPVPRFCSSLGGGDTARAF